jgi:hypothetical protein
VLLLKCSNILQISHTYSCEGIVRALITGRENNPSESEEKFVKLYSLPSDELLTDKATKRMIHDRGIHYFLESKYKKVLA